MSDVLARLKDVAGPKGFIDKMPDMDAFTSEWRGRYTGHTPLVLMPESTAQVSAILSICNETNTPIVPQGGNTGLVGGQIPLHGEVLLSLRRMNRIRSVADNAMICEAGVILADAQGAALAADRYFPLSLAPEGSCTIGGNLSTNAGGIAVLRYGNARDLVLGIEVVLADGRVLDMLRTLRKDNTGYDLKQLFIGAEGTLGVITAAALKLFARPQMHVTALVAVNSPASAIELLGRLQVTTGGLVSAFELIPKIALQMVVAHIPGTSNPVQTPSDWYVLLEVAGAGNLGLRDAVETELSQPGGVSDSVVAHNEAQRTALWRLRETISEAQKPEGASIKHDVSLPLTAIPEFLARGMALAVTIVPGARPVPFGHLGDGNIHFNISVPKGGDGAAFLAQWETMSRAVHDLVASYGGSISAEHGIGRMKRDEMPRYKSETEMDVMRALKRMMDPKGILNPGAVI